MNKYLRSMSDKVGFSLKSRKLLRRLMKPKFLYFVSSTTKPLSIYCGFDRGTPLDRFYIQQFLNQNKKLIRGKCLEVLNNDYTRTYGEDRVTKSDILDINIENKEATIIDDLRHLTSVQDNSYDCIILTQVLQFIDDIDAAIETLYRILKPGGTILATLPSVSRIDCTSGITSDYWRFTTASAHYAFVKKFSSERLSISSAGNVRSGIYFYAGCAVEEVPVDILLQDDPSFPLIVTVKAMK